MNRVACVGLILLVLLGRAGAETNAVVNKPGLKIKGYGFFGNREMKSNLNLLESTKKRVELFDANYIEDAVLLMTARLQQAGFLHPEITAEIFSTNGQKLEFTWRRAIEPPLPRPLFAREVVFTIRKGLFYRYESVEFEGLKAIPPKQAATYFYATGGLLPTHKGKIYTPQKLQRGMSSLEEILSRRGYGDAKVSVLQTNVDDVTGRVRVKVRVDEGAKYIVKSIREQTVFSTNAAPLEVQTVQTNENYSKLWAQDFSQALKTTNYHRGFPDASVVLKPAQTNAHDGMVDLDMVAEVKTGPQVFVRDIRFEGQNRTKVPVMKSRVDLEGGGTNVLDRTKAEEGRNRLSRLGIFDTVELGYEAVTETNRDVIYRVKEGKQIDVNLLAGFGSYELFRGGVEVEQYNVWGRAHHQRLVAAQSFKSSSANYTYTAPELAREEIDLFINSSWLRRQEIDFTRHEFGGGIGAKKSFKEIDTDVSVQYKYQVLEALQSEVVLGPLKANVGAFIFDVKHDKRDHPLYPRSGYKIASTLELASDYLGGDVSYQRVELSVSYHRPIGEENHWLHLGLSHGLVNTQGDPLRELPFNKRFFPGGENSVRGYGYGEASPRDKFGRVVGAEFFTLGNIEFEQGLSDTWSVVFFTDAIAFGAGLPSFPGDDYLISVGLGLNWRTVVGPVRLEYGYNLHRRKGDPVGALQFSIGFPF